MKKLFFASLILIFSFVRIFAEVSYDSIGSDADMGLGRTYNKMLAETESPDLGAYKTWEDAKAPSSGRKNKSVRLAGIENDEGSPMQCFAEALSKANITRENTAKKAFSASNEAGLKESASSPFVGEDTLKESDLFKNEKKSKKKSEQSKPQ